MAALRGTQKGPARDRRHGHGPNSVTRLQFASAAFVAVIVVASLLPSPSSAQQRPTATNSASHKTVAKGTPSFADVTRASGIDFHLTCGGLEKRYIMESMCGGVAVFDYDNDGWMDIFL